MKKTILVLDNDASSRSFLEKLLGNEFQVHVFPCNSEDPRILIRKHTPSIILIDSFIIAKSLKSDPSTASIPMIVISSRNNSSDVKEGLSMGAEDFITKPFDPKELLLRIRSHLKITLSADQLRFIRVGSLEIDTSDRTAKFNGVEVPLTITEYDILRLLASKRGTVVSREEIMKIIWKDSAPDTTDRTIDVHIRSLRKKVPEFADHIKSVYGVGYQYIE
jgi:DNA-binding response OmpR family regulator